MRHRPQSPRVDAAVAERTLVEYARLSENALLARLGTHPDGLTNHDAALRYRDVGPNSIADEHPPPAWRQFATFVLNPLSLLLLMLAAVSYLTGGKESAVVIMAIVLLSVLFAFLQEHRSSKAAEKLRALVHTRVTLLRRPRPHAGEPPGPANKVSVPLAHIVPGDIVLLSAGNLVPGDVRILKSRDLFVSQSALTGESLPVEKHPAAPAPGESALELPNLALMGSYVISGTATAVVLATGIRTQFGAIAHATGARRGLTGFDLGIRRYIWLIIRFMLVMVPAVFLINGLTKGDWMEAFLFALAVAVGLTPEMLPMVITVNLAKGALAMAGKRVIVKRLAAIQNFGAMDVLATDKTGTLTQDRVLLERHVDIFGAESRRVLEFTCLNSLFQSGLRNLLDEAVLAHAELHEHIKSGAGYRKIDEIPFDFERRRMSVVVESSDGAHHLLINNLLYDVSQTAVATDNVDAEFLARPRRWDISGIGRYMACIGPLSSIFDYTTFAVLAWVFGALEHPALFQTGWFVESLLSQTLIVHVIRTGRVPFVESRASRTLLMMTVAISLVGVWLPFSPVAPMLGLAPLPIGYWGALAAILVAYLTLTQIVKTWVAHRFRLE